MIGLRALLVAAVLGAVPLTLTSCGSGDTVDNSTCSGTSAASGTSAYYPEVGTNDDNQIVGQRIPQMPHTHVDPPAKVTYEHNPPTSGCHYNLGYGTAPIVAGAYTKHIDAEYWVHNLEHGYVVIAYNCPQGCKADLDKLREWYSRLPPDPGLAAVQQQARAQHQTFTAYAKVIIVPWSFDHKFAAISWDYYDPMDTLSLDEVQRFYNNHYGHSPEGLNTP